MGVSRSAVSKQIGRLETDLGVVLLHRTTRSVNLTEAGRVFDAKTAKIDRTLEQAVEDARCSIERPQGTVSFTLPSAMGSALMPALTTSFQNRWPDLTLNIHFEDEMRDLIADNLDLAIRISRKLPDSSLISRRLATTKKVLAASPRYLEKFGVPQNPSDLEEHSCLGRGSATTSGATWSLLNDDEPVDASVSFALSTNNNLATILAACLDAGIVYVPETCIQGELSRGQLQIIPGLADPEPLGVYAIYPHRNAAAKVKVLVDFIEGMLPDLASLDRWIPLTDRVAEASGAIKVGSR